MSKKVGIMTLYSNTRNFGGALQSYALCEVILGMGFDAEQITYDIHDVELIRTSKKQKIKKALNPKVLFGFVSKRMKSLIYGKLYSKRNEKTQKFLDDIPHSVRYTKETLYEVNSKYDYFITGSDQVWNFDWYNPNMFLAFVKSDGIKISYAASLGRNDLSRKEKELLKSHLKDFKAVSVREPESVEIVKESYEKEVVCTLDPTLLLERDAWDKVAAKSLINEKKYIFCYFLSEDIRQKKVIKEFARKKGIQVLYIPHVEYFSLKGSYNYGKALSDATINDFVWLIKNADYVFTDSFHCSVFSCLYEKQFFAFSRVGRKHMGSRIINLLDIFDCKDRMIDAYEITTEYLLEMEDISFSDSERFTSDKKKSMDFLMNALGGDKDVESTCYHCQN